MGSGAELIEAKVAECGGCQQEPAALSHFAGRSVIAVEAIVTAPKAGTTKNELVLSSIDAVAKAGETSDNKLVAAISELVDRIVGILNTSKIFTSAA